MPCYTSLLIIDCYRSFLQLNTIAISRTVYLAIRFIAQGFSPKMKMKVYIVYETPITSIDYIC